MIRKAAVLAVLVAAALSGCGSPAVTDDAAKSAAIACEKVYVEATLKEDPAVESVDVFLSGERDGATVLNHSGRRVYVEVQVSTNWEESYDGRTVLGDATSRALYYVNGSTAVRVRGNQFPTRPAGVGSPNETTCLFR